MRAFERVGYTVVSGASDWVFGPDDRAIQLEVLAGWAGAAARARRLAAWRHRRLAGTPRARSLPPAAPACGLVMSISSPAERPAER